MPDNTDLVEFDFQSAQRIADTVKGYERQSADLKGTPVKRGNDPLETLWAVLGAMYAPVTIGSGATAITFWEWKEVRLLKTGTWENVTNGRKGDHTATVPNLAAMFSPYNAKQGDTVMLRRCPIKDESFSPPVWNMNWAVVSFELFVETWCPVSNEDPDCAANKPIFTSFATGFNILDYLTDDYELIQLQSDSDVCDSTRLLLRNKYNTFIHTVYGEGDTHACNTKIVRLADEASNGNPPSGGTPVLVSPSDNANRYSVYWTMTSETEADPCSCLTGYDRSAAKIQGDVFMDQCSFPTTFEACDGETWGVSNKIKAGPGLAFSNDKGFTCSDYATLELNANIISSDGSVTISTTPGPCTYTWDLSAEAPSCPTITATASTGDPGSDAAVTVDDSTPCAPVFHFTIPQGLQGDPGTNGTDGTDGTNGLNPTDLPDGTYPLSTGTGGGIVTANGSIVVSGGQITAINPIQFTP